MSRKNEDISQKNADGSKRNVYLDYAATTPVLREVKQFCQPFFSEVFGNASSIHSFGIKARVAIEQSRDKIGKSLNINKDSIIFTGSGTESDNMAILGVVRKKFRQLKKEGTVSSPAQVRVIVSNIEHSAVYNSAKYLKDIGFDVRFTPVTRDGFIDLNKFKLLCSTEASAGNSKISSTSAKSIPVLVSIHTANNEIGTIQPMTEIIKIAHGNGIPVHTDAVQAVGKIPLDFIITQDPDEGVDFLSASSHKLYAPKGSGFLYIRNKELKKSIEPLMFGGGHEEGLRPSTENVMAIAGMGESLRILIKDLTEESKKEAEFRDYLYSHVIREIDGVIINGSMENRLPNNLNFSIPDVDGSDLALVLDREGFAVSTGSACSSHSGLPSRVLLAIGRTASQAEGSLRVTLGRFTKRKDIDDFLSVLPDAIKEIKNS